MALDQTPIGNFIEVEGDPRGIRRAVVALGLDFADAVPYTYARLYAERRKGDPDTPARYGFPGPSSLTAWVPCPESRVPSPVHEGLRSRGRARDAFPAGHGGDSEAALSVPKRPPHPVAPGAARAAGHPGSGRQSSSSWRRGRRPSARRRGGSPEAALLPRARNPRHGGRSPQRLGFSFGRGLPRRELGRGNPAGLPGLSCAASWSPAAPRRSSASRTGNPTVTRRFNPKGIASWASETRQNDPGAAGLRSSTRVSLAPRLLGRDSPRGEGLARRRACGSRSWGRGAREWALGFSRRPVCRPRQPARFPARDSRSAGARGGPFPTRSRAVRRSLPSARPRAGQERRERIRGVEQRPRRRVRLGAGASVIESSAVWTGCEVGSGREIPDAGASPLPGEYRAAGTVATDALLWGGLAAHDALGLPPPLSSSSRRPGPFSPPVVESPNLAVRPKTRTTAIRSLPSQDRPTRGSIRRAARRSRCPTVESDRIVRRSRHGRGSAGIGHRVGQDRRAYVVSAPGKAIPSGGRCHVMSAVRIPLPLPSA